MRVYVDIRLAGSRAQSSRKQVEATQSIYMDGEPVYRCVCVRARTRAYVRACAYRECVVLNAAYRLCIGCI